VPTSKFKFLEGKFWRFWWQPTINSSNFHLNSYPDFVHFLSTGRFNWKLEKGGVKDRTRLDAIHEYNASMHGNDILDAVLAKYSVYFRSRRWTLRLACWAIDTAVACGYINAKYFGITRNKDCLHADWISQLIDGLIEKGGKNVQESNTQPNPQVVHFPIHLGGDKNNRKMC